MPQIQYIVRDFREEARWIIEQVNVICEEYKAQGFDLTLRQVFYQFVSRDLIPNTDRSYKRLGSIVNDGRLAGLIDWEFIEDRTRFLRSPNYWESPDEMITTAADQFERNLWEASDQEYRPEVWVEKDALVGIVQAACDPLRVPYLSCRGYVSQSEMWSAGQRLLKTLHGGAYPVILHMGDHDPSGIDMTRDIEARLSLFTGELIEVRRIALNMDQVLRYRPPPNPAKLTDVRAAGYVRAYGEQSWELDALEPRVLTDLIRAEVAPFIDAKTWNVEHAKDQEQRDRMKTVADRWLEINAAWPRIEAVLDEETTDG